ncbi:MAG TPA: PLP-dependent transferase, partial [Microbacterium sp.]|nr:PLP-dependent transferase [Microbacterium sp.]
LIHRPVPPEARPAADVLRLSIGLENVDDLIADLARAFAALPAGESAGAVSEELHAVR